ncbi:hypothetical protein KSS87_018243, partial [Heliosperma pusillum]
KIPPSMAGDRTVVRVVDPCSSSSSSSIGMNSDDEDDDGINNCMRNNNNNNNIKDDDDDDDEVESKLKKSPFDSAVDALEQALPMRRGISKFYSGKSKSFASLGDAACSSIKDITKAENAYSRKRKTLLANSLFHDKARTSPFKNSGIGGGIEKKSTSINRSQLALGVAMNNRGSRIDENDSSREENGNGRWDPRTPSLSPPSSPALPPPWRSFSVADLQHCAVSVSSLNSNLGSLMGKKSKLDEVL